MIEHVTYPLPLPDGSTVLVTVHWEDQRVLDVDCPTYQELWRLMGVGDPRDWASHFVYQAKLPNCPPRIRGAARLWQIVLAYCRNPVKEKAAAEQAAWQQRNPGATRTALGARTGD